MRHKPTISAMTATCSVHRSNRDSDGEMIRKSTL